MCRPYFQVMCLDMCQWYHHHKLFETCQKYLCNNNHHIVRYIPNLYENSILSEFHGADHQG